MRDLLLGSTCAKAVGHASFLPNQHGNHPGDTRILVIKRAVPPAEHGKFNTVIASAATWSINRVCGPGVSGVNFQLPPGLTGPSLNVQHLFQGVSRKKSWGVMVHLNVFLFLLVSLSSNFTLKPTPGEVISCFGWYDRGPRISLQRWYSGPCIDAAPCVLLILFIFTITTPRVQLTPVTPNAWTFLDATIRAVLRLRHATALVQILVLCTIAQAELCNP